MEEIKKNTIKYNWQKNIVFLDSLPRNSSEESRS